LQGQSLRVNAAAAAGGDNRHTVLQRLAADMQLLQSKLHQFAASTPTAVPNIQPNVGQSAGPMLPSSSADAKIDQLKQHYDVEVLCF